MFSQLQWKPETNRTRKKSKSGCKVCKLRKIRCDEMKPACLNCKVYYCDRIQQCQYDKVALPPKRQRHVTSQPSPTRNLGFFISHDDPDNSALPPRRSCVPSIMGSGILSTFGIHPICNLPGVNELLCYFLTYTVGKCLPVGCKVEQSPLVRYWWPLMQEDQFLFTSMMLLVTHELEWKRGNFNEYHSSVYSREVIRLLQERIEDPDRAVSDSSIGAVAMLSTIEFGKKNMVMMRMHINGLKRMVSLRGGLLKIRDSNAIVASVIHWLALNSMHDSIFPLDDTVHHSMHLEYLLADITDSDGLSLSSRYLDLEAFGVAQEVVEIMLETRYLCAKLNLPIPRVYNICWPVNSIVQRLLHMKITDEGAHSANLTDACRWATCVFVFLPFDNQFPDPTLLLNTFLYKLKAALNNLVPYSSPESPIIFWLLAIGAAISNSLERSWFIGHLIPASANMTCWPDMEKSMQGILWLDGYLDCLFIQLWEEIDQFAQDRDAHDPFGSIQYLPQTPEGLRFIECGADSS